MELTSLLTARTDDSHATPVNEYLNLSLDTTHSFLIMKLRGMDIQELVRFYAYFRIK